MTQQYASSMQAVAIRVSRLMSDGSIASGPSGSYVLTSDFISLSFTAEVNEGIDIEQVGGDGTICASYRGPDTLKRVNIELAICNPDPEASEILAGGTLLTDAGVTVGYAPPQVGVNGNPNGAAIEVWSRAIVNGKADGTKPYWHWVLPYTIMAPSGDRALENGQLATTFSGWGVGNEAFDEGPAGDWPFISDRPYQYARSATAPIGEHGYVTVTP
jgi:hypothetical protein